MYVVVLVGVIVLLCLFFVLFLYFFFVFFFFFSSRRRHTRWNCDWSSDVCSSDLVSFVKRQQLPVRRNRTCSVRKIARGQTLSSTAPVGSMPEQIFWPGPKIGRASCRERV